ncbi:MAG: CBS domain-containing protein [Candidatus Hodarchaeaceae archaeon]|nr:CBS domain-containing protein [Candidatus Hodarchaeaceae archaeon]
MVVCAKDFMTKKVIKVDKSKNALAAAKLMAKTGVGSIVVVDRGKPVGIITDRDIMVQVVAKGLKPGRVRVNKFMSRPLVTVTPDTPMIDVAKLMEEHGIRRVPVVARGKAVGIVTSTDLGKASKILAPYLLPRIPEIYLTPKKSAK